jgi:hypothetical protein
MYALVPFYGLTDVHAESVLSPNPEGTSTGAPRSPPRTRAEKDGEAHHRFHSIDQETPAFSAAVKSCADTKPNTASKCSL